VAIKEIYIIRHGETHENKQGIVQGRGVNSDLNNLGRSQAQKFYDMYQHHEFDVVCVSSLKRTYQSIYPFTKDGHNIKSFKELDEINWGTQEGKKPCDETKDNFLKVVRQWDSGIYDPRMELGENPLEVQSRQQVFIDFVKKTDYKKYLVCTHGRALRILLCTLLGKELKCMNDLPHQNFGLYKLHLSEDVFELILENDTEHLKN
jgi:phosphoserine phosphatase